MVFNGAEMRALPAHFANDTYVNGTNYWRMISAGFYAPSLDITTSIPFAGPPNGNDGPANSLDETLKAYDKLADPDYDSAVTAGALALVVGAFLCCTCATGLFAQRQRHRRERRRRACQ